MLHHFWENLTIPLQKQNINGEKYSDEIQDEVLLISFCTFVYKIVVVITSNVHYKF